METAEGVEERTSSKLGGSLVNFGMNSWNCLTLIIITGISASFSVSRDKEPCFDSLVERSE